MKRPGIRREPLRQRISDFLLRWVPIEGQV